MRCYTHHHIYKPCNKYQTDWVSLNNNRYETNHDAKFKWEPAWLVYIEAHISKISMRFSGWIWLMNKVSKGIVLWCHRTNYLNIIFKQKINLPETFFTFMPWCMPGSLNNGFLWSPWRWRHSWHSQHICIPQFYISGNRPIRWELIDSNVWKSTPMGTQPWLWHIGLFE